MTTTSDKRKRDEGVEHHDSVRILDEAAETAAMALYTAGHHSNCATNGDPLKVKTVCDCYFDGYRHSARAALAAAYPILLAQITEGIAAEILDQCDDLATTPCRACRQAATITRAYGKATS